MVYFWALDLVTEASWPRRARACSKPKRRDTFDAFAGEDGGLYSHLVGRSLMNAPAGAGIFAFGIPRMQSMSNLSLFSGPEAPGKSRCGRILAYG